MHTPWITLAVAAIAVAGCATPAEQAARMEREMDLNIQIYGPACEKLGFKRDTDTWRNCVLRLVQNDSYYRYYGGYGYPYTTTCLGGPAIVHCTTF